MLVHFAILALGVGHNEHLQIFEGYKLQNSNNCLVLYIDYI